MKKIVLLTSILFLGISGFAQMGAWITKSSNFTPIQSGVKQFSVVDTMVIWAIAYDGSGVGNTSQQFTRSTDGGNTWTAGTIPAPNVWDICGIHALSDSVAWAIFYEAQVTGLGQIWKTTDAGQNWTQQGIGLFTDANQSFINNIYFWNDTLGCAMGDQVNGTFEIYTTTDGGTTWDTVPAGNIAPPLDSLENAWTTHFAAYNDTIWFDTNEGRVYRSTDYGQTWTASATNLPVVTGDAIDICFLDANYGIARLYDDVSLTNAVVITTDGGTTWSPSPFSPTGDMFGGDIKGVPGVPMMMISTGISSISGYTGTSYSTDGGQNWTTVETGTQRGYLGIADSLTMWCGGFTTSPTVGGIFKWFIPTPVACNDPSVTPGISSVDTNQICDNDTARFSSTGVYTPVIGDVSGVSWILTSADISGSADPLGEPSFITSYLIENPAPSSSNRLYVNNGSIVGQPGIPYGLTYYWTPIAFGNATEPAPPAVYLQDLLLDANCTFTGTSVGVLVLDPNDALCTGVGIYEINKGKLAVYSKMIDRNTLDILINSENPGNAFVQILDLTGRIVYTTNMQVTKGSNHKLVGIESLSSGAYIINAAVNGLHAANKIIKN